MSKFYLTVDGVTENTVEIKRSKFIATLSHVESGEDAEAFVRAVRKRYPDATHNCYAYIADELGNETRFSDDGEPGGRAGQPMLEVLKKRGVVRAAVVVTRYFGGIKLGAGGLVLLTAAVWLSVRGRRKRRRRAACSGDIGEVRQP